MYAKLLLLLGMALPCTLTSIYCPPNACQDLHIECRDISNTCRTRGRIETTGGGFCGCCPICILTLGEGDICVDRRNPPGTPIFQRGECEQGLTCNHTSIQCEPVIVGKRQAAQTCAERRAQMAAQIEDSIREHGFPPVGGELPSCEADDTYSPVQCLGSVCSCVMPDGARIDGYSVHRWENQGMNCACARAKEAVRQSGRIGVMHSCSANGNYEPVQCTGSVCYCVDATGNRVGQSTAHIASSDSLNC